MTAERLRSIGRILDGASRSIVALALLASCRGNAAPHAPAHDATRDATPSVVGRSETPPDPVPAPEPTLAAPQVAEPPGARTLDERIASASARALGTERNHPARRELLCLLGQRELQGGTGLPFDLPARTRSGIVRRAVLRRIVRHCVPEADGDFYQLLGSVLFELADVPPGWLAFALEEHPTNDVGERALAGWARSLARLRAGDRAVDVLADHVRTRVGAPAYTDSLDAMVAFLARGAGEPALVVLARSDVEGVGVGLARGLAVPAPASHEPRLRAFVSIASRLLEDDRRTGTLDRAEPTVLAFTSLGRETLGGPLLAELLVAAPRSRLVTFLAVVRSIERFAEPGEPRIEPEYRGLSRRANQLLGGDREAADCADHFEAESGFRPSAAHGPCDHCACPFDRTDFDAYRCRR